IQRYVTIGACQFPLRGRDSVFAVASSFMPEKYYIVITTLIMRFLAIPCFAIFFLGCQKGIAPLPANSIDTIAAFSLSGTPNSCSHAIASGSYKKATALTSQNQLSLEVNVTKTGAWNLSTDLVDGISFSAAGHFITTGIQSIILYGSGKPAQEGNYLFALIA